MQNTSTRLAVCLVVALFAVATFTATATDSNSGEDPLAALVAKAGPDLKDLLRGGATAFDAIVTFAPHSGVTAAGFPDRATAMAELEARSAPLFGSVADLVSAHGGEVVNQWAAAPAVKVTGGLGLLNAIATLDSVIHVEADYHGAVRLIDPMQGAGDGVGTSNTQGRQMIQAEEIWALGWKGAGITVSVIDTGIDPSHEAFKNADGSTRVAKYSNCVSGTCNPNATPIDDHGHGTHVAGTVLGTDLYNDPTWGRYQEVGVAPEATLYVVKFLDGGGGGTWEAGLAAVQEAFNQGADISSNSWGGGCTGATAIIALVRQLTDLGMISVFAAGNSGFGGVLGPGCGESSLTVGAVDGSKNIAWFSSRGPCSDPDTGSGSRICPDVVAKGVNVRSAIPRSGASWGDPSGYRNWEGTSMATPHVAGAVALIEQMKRDITGDGWDTAARAEEAVLKVTAEDLGTPGEDNNYGAGLVQLLPVYALLEANEDALIVETFGISLADVRQSQSTTLHFGVRNLGSAVATGTFTGKLISPSGAVTTLKQSTPSLGLLEGERVDHTFTVGTNTPFGTYTFEGRFDYSWQNGNGDTITGSVFRSGTFTVYRVVLQVVLDNFDGSTTLGSVQDLAFSVTNVGNDRSPFTRVEFRVPGAYEFLPGDNFNPMDTKTRYANPTPNTVTEPMPGVLQESRLVWNLGELAAGGSWAFSSNMLPIQLGDHTVRTTINYQDGISQNFVHMQNDVQTVSLI